MISITERKRRYEDLAYAMGSCEMEGCIFTAERKNRSLYERKRYGRKGRFIYSKKIN